jgi:hypothetical protein
MTASQKHETFAGESIIHGRGFVPVVERDPIETTRLPDPYNAKIVPNSPEAPAKE